MTRRLFCVYVSAFFDYNVSYARGTISIEDFFRAHCRGGSFLLGLEIKYGEPSGRVISGL